MTPKAIGSPNSSSWLMRTAATGSTLFPGIRMGRANRSRWRTLYFVVASLPGCACTSFEEMDVTDERELGGTSLNAEIQDALDAFADATGREGVCVPEVQVVAADDARLEDHGGAYLGRRQPILISAGVLNAG